MTTPAELLARYSNQSQLSSFFTDKVGIFSILSYADGETIYDGITSATTALENAITAATVEGGILLIPTTENGSTYIIDDDVTIPSNVSLWSIQGALLSISSGKTLTVNGGIESGIYQIFSGSGSVVGSLLNNVVYPEWYGALGDGSNDDSKALNSALVMATNATCKLTRNKTYLCKDYISIPSCDIIGFNSKIKMDSTFSAISDGTTNQNRAGIYNSGYDVWNSTTANKIKIEGVIFENDNLDLPFLLSFANVDGFLVERCSFIVKPISGTRDYLGAIEMRKCWRNVVFDNCYFEQYNGNDTGLSGDCLELTNWTADGENTDNDCHNATVNNCRFEKNVVDEWIWVNSASGKIYGVVISNNDFKQYATGLNGNGGSGLAIVRGREIYPYSECNNVLIENNDFYSEKLVTSCLQIGRSADDNTVTKSSNCRVNNNRIYTEETNDTATSKAGILFYADNQGTNNTATENVITTKDSPTDGMTAGIQGGDLISENRIIGTFEHGLLACDKCSDNYVNVSGGKAMQNCNNLLRDYLQGDIASVYRVTQDFYATLCEFVTDTGSNVIEAQANVSNVTFDKCTFSGASASRPVYSSLAPTSTFTFLDCINNTTGYSMLVGTNADEKILKMRGNKFKPVSQVETITCTAGESTGAGNITMTITASGMSNSPKAVVVAIGLADSVNDVGLALRTALDSDADVSGFFTVSGADASAILTSITPVANDTTMEFGFVDTDTTGVTFGASTNTTLGRADYDDYYALTGADPANLDVFFRLTAPIGFILHDLNTFDQWQKQITGSASTNWKRIYEYIP